MTSCSPVPSRSRVCRRQTAELEGQRLPEEQHSTVQTKSSLELNGQDWGAANSPLTSRFPLPQNVPANPSRGARVGLALLRAGTGVGWGTTVLQRDAYPGGPDRNLRRERARDAPFHHPFFPHHQTPLIFSLQETKELAFPANSLGPRGHPKSGLEGFGRLLRCCPDSCSKSLSDLSLGLWAEKGNTTSHNTEIHLKPDSRT